MLNKIIIGCIIILTISFIIYKLRSENNIENISQSHAKLINENTNLKKYNKKLEDIKFADEDIFKLIRCINIPQSPVCADVGGDGDIVCRSKLIDCNKFKLVLLNNPVAVERMKIATDKYYQTSKPRNLSDLTYDIKNVSWFF